MSARSVTPLKRKKTGGTACFFGEAQVNDTIYVKMGCVIIKMIKCSKDHAFEYRMLPEAASGRPIPWCRIDHDELLISEEVAEEWFKRSKRSVV